MKKFIIDQNLLNTVHGYLMTRPMQEIEGLVHALRNLTELVDGSGAEVVGPKAVPDQQAEETPKA